MTPVPHTYLQASNFAPSSFYNSGECALGYSVVSPSGVMCASADSNIAVVALLLTPSHSESE
jgi:hypothetical protein